MSQVGTALAHYPSSMTRLALAILVASAGLCGQTDVQGAPQLLDCVERPYAYISLDASPPRGKAAKNQPDHTSVRKLLSNPSLDVLFTGDLEAKPQDAGGSTRALSMVRGMLSKGASQIELALTGIVGRGGKPLLVLRARLEHDQADRLRLVLEQTADLASPHRKLGGHQTFTLKGGHARGAGDVVEMAMVGDDFVVGNDTSAMREVLDPEPATTSAGEQRQVLSANRQFQQLRKRLEVPPGSLLAYGDWKRLGRRLQSSMSGAHAELLASSGLGSARSVMMTIAPAQPKKGDDKKGDAFAATLLLDFEFDAPKRGAGSGIDGWFAATQPVSAKQLLKELPRAGLGGLVLSVDLRAVASHSPRTSHLYWDLREAFSNFGLDFKRNVLGRLVSRGTVQLHFGKDGDAFAAVSPVYAVRAKNRRSAQDLFTDMRRVVEENEIGKLVEVKDEKGKRKLELLELNGRTHAFSAFLMVHNDSLLLAREQETLTQLFEELKKSRPRSRRDQLAGSAIKSIGGEEVAGLFDLDLAPMFERIMAALGSPNVDLSSLPKRHVGYLATDRSDDGAVVRVRVLSSR